MTSELETPDLRTCTAGATGRQQGPRPPSTGGGTSVLSVSEFCFALSLLNSNA